MKDRAELCNRTEPNLNDMERTLLDMNINLDELSEYAEQFDSKALVTDPVPVFPVPSVTRLNHLKPGSREVLHRPIYVEAYLPPMYPEMETADDTIISNTSLNDEDKIDIKTENMQTTSHSGVGGVDSSDIRPRETSVMMTKDGKISTLDCQGRMPESRTPAIFSRMPMTDDNSRPGSVEPTKPTKARPTKPAEDTSDEGLIEDDDDNFNVNVVPTTIAQATLKPNKKSKLSVFQHKKAKTLGKKAKSEVKKATGKPGPGRPRGPAKKKKKLEIIPTSKELVSDDDSSPERHRGPPVKKAKPAPPPPPEPPVKLYVPLSIPVPDPNVLPSHNPLIPNYHGFDNISSQFDVKKDAELVVAVAKAPQQVPSSVFGEALVKPNSGDQQESVTRKESKESSKEAKKEKKLKDKAMKKSKKDKKDKNKDRDKKEHSKDKPEKKDKEKKKKSKDRERPVSPQLFAATDQKTTTLASVPKIKIKELKNEEIKAPKIVIKSLPVPVANIEPVMPVTPVVPVVKKIKERPKQVDIFSDPIQLERPKSAASDASSDPGRIGKPHKKPQKDKDSPKERPRQRATSGGGKRAVEKRGSAIAAEAAIHATPQNEGGGATAAAAPPEGAGGTSSTGFAGGSVVIQTVGYFVDSEGNQIWICPACGKQDDGSPMIGCDDKCDDWYHWNCVGIQQEPADNEDWFCPRCVAKKSSVFLDRKSPGKRGRPPKMR